MDLNTIFISPRYDSKSEPTIVVYRSHNQANGGLDIYVIPKISEDRSYIISGFSANENSFQEHGIKGDEIEVSNENIELKYPNLIGFIESAKKLWNLNFKKPIKKAKKHMIP